MTLPERVAFLVVALVCFLLTHAILSPMTGEEVVGLTAAVIGGMFFGYATFRWLDGDFRILPRDEES